MNNKCCLCQGEIPLERLDALKFLEVHESQYTCVSCKSQFDTKVKAIYAGFSGISPMVICDNVEQNRVRFDDLNEEVRKQELEDVEGIE